MPLSDLLCPGCERIYHEPITYPCGHSVCVNCTHTLILERENEMDEVICPVSSCQVTSVCCSSSFLLPSPLLVLFSALLFFLCFSHLLSPLIFSSSRVFVSFPFFFLIFSCPPPYPSLISSPRLFRWVMTLK